MPTLVVVIVLALVLVVLAYFFLRAPAAETDEPQAERNELWWQRRIREIARNTPELRQLFQRLHYSLETEARCDELLLELKELIRVDIPDYQAFQEALRKIEARLEARPEEAGSISEEEDAPFAMRNRRLLKEVLQSGDSDAVIALLNRNPFEEQLPFVEQIPLHRAGKVIWRSPVELVIMRKRPADRARFQRALEELERVVRTSKIRRAVQAKKEVFETIARTRRDLDRENAYMPTPIKLLEEKTQSWLEPRETLAKGKREQLERLMVGMLELQERSESRAWAGNRVDPQVQSGFKAKAEELAREYIHANWMHTPWLTTLALRNLLRSELIQLRGGATADSGAPSRVLKLVWDEVASGRYDSEESIRRLRSLETKGLFVHSLNYALLRMNRPEAAPTSTAS